MERSPSRTALTGLAALAVAMGVGRFAFTPILPMMQADAGGRLEHALVGACLLLLASVFLLTGRAYTGIHRPF